MGTTAAKAEEASRKKAVRQSLHDNECALRAQADDVASLMMATQRMMQATAVRSGGEHI